MSKGFSSPHLFMFLLVIGGLALNAVSKFNSNCVLYYRRYAKKRCTGVCVCVCACGGSFTRNIGNSHRRNLNCEDANFHISTHFK